MRPHASASPDDHPPIRRRLRMPKRRTQLGATPGTIVVDPGAARTEVAVWSYGPDEIGPESAFVPADVARRLETSAVTWLRVQGLSDRAILTAIADLVHMHPLVLEDVVHTHQRPKIEPYGADLFVVARANDDATLSATRQISLLVGPRFVVSFEEVPGPLFDPVCERIRRGLGRIRKLGPDYLAHALIDTAVDSFFPALDAASDRIDALEHETLERPREVITARIYELKRDLSVLRRMIWPFRDMLNRLARGEFDLVQEQTAIFFRDAHDHAMQVLDHLDQLRDMSAGLLELHVSMVGNQMNDVMRMLTLIATIFIPLTFVTGLYGMNFDRTVSGWNMPELGAPYGYPIVLGVMAIVTAGMLGWFYRQGWIGRRR